MTRILVTGATGAVGKSLIPYLLEHIPCEILTINRSIEKAAFLFGERNDLRHSSIDDVDIIKSFAPEVVIHMASYVSSYCDVSTGLKLIESNITYGFKLLEALKNCSSVRLFINFGTFAEFRSGHDTSDNAYLYSATKTAFRAFAEFYSRSFGFDLVHAVPYTIYGTKDERKKILDLIFDSFNSQEPVKMTLGNQVLDFIHVRDVCRIIERIIVFDEIHKYHFQNLHMGTGQGHSIREVASIMEELLNKKANIEWGAIAYRERDVMFAVADTSRLIELGCEPAINLMEGLKKYLEGKS